MDYDDDIDRATRERWARWQEQNYKGYSSTAEANALYQLGAPRLSDYIKQSLRIRTKRAKKNGVAHSLAELGDLLPPDSECSRLNKRALKAFDPDRLALATMAALLNAIAARTGDETAPGTDTIMAVGYAIKHLGKPRGLFSTWEPEAVVRAGNWLIDCCAGALRKLFVVERGVIYITEEALHHADALVEIEMRRNLVFPLKLTPPQPWTRYRQGLRTFVRHSRAEAQIKRAMRDGSMQTCIDGVNWLQSVQWATSPISVEAARELIDAADLVRKPREPKYLFEARMRQRKITVLGAANFNLANFYTPMSLDWRGRVYADPHHNFAREDLVRSQFRFARGEPIDSR